MGNDLLVQGGQLLGSELRTRDVLIQDGRIARVGEHLDAPAGAEVLDATGMVVLPGLINAHYHSGENFNPGLYENLPLDLWFVHSHQVTRAEPLSAEGIYARTALGATLDAPHRHDELRRLPLRGARDHAGDPRARGPGLPRHRHAGHDSARRRRQAVRGVAAARRRRRRRRARGRATDPRRDHAAGPRRGGALARARWADRHRHGPVGAAALHRRAARRLAGLLPRPRPGLADPRAGDEVAGLHLAALARQVVRGASGRARHARAAGHARAHGVAERPRHRAHGLVRHRRRSTA